MPCSASSYSDARRRGASCAGAGRRAVRTAPARPAPARSPAAAVHSPDRTAGQDLSFRCGQPQRSSAARYPQNVILRSPRPLNPAHAGRMEENSSPPDSESPGPVPADPAPAKPARPAALVRVGSPDTVLAVIPGLLGFHPSRSLVVVGAGPPRGRIEVAFRYDLPEPPDVGAAAKIAAHAGRDPGQAPAHAGHRGRLRTGADGHARGGRAGPRAAPGRHHAARLAARRERQVLVLLVP